MTFALISDLHLEVWWNFLDIRPSMDPLTYDEIELIQRLLEKTFDLNKWVELKSLNLYKAVFIVGDIHYDPRIRAIVFEYISNRLNIPVYVADGNHDFWHSHLFGNNTPMNKHYVSKNAGISAIRFSRSVIPNIDILSGNMWTDCWRDDRLIKNASQLMPFGYPGERFTDSKAYMPMVIRVWG